MSGAQPLRPVNAIGPLGLRRPTRLDVESGVLVAYDVHRNRTVLPDARALVPFAVASQRLSDGLAVLDDAGRVMVAINARFDPYAVAGFAKAHGLNVRLLELAPGEALNRFTPAEGFRPIEAYAMKYVWEIPAVFALCVMGTVLGRKVAIALAPGDASFAVEFLGMCVGLLLGLKIGPVLASLWRWLRERA